MDTPDIIGKIMPDPRRTMRRDYDREVVEIGHDLVKAGQALSETSQDYASLTDLCQFLEAIAKDLHRLRAMDYEPPITSIHKGTETKIANNTT